MTANALLLCERELRRLNRSPRTIREVVACARRFLDGRDPAQIEHEDVRRFLAETQARGLTRSTQASYLLRLRTFFQALVRRGLLEADPTEGLQAPAPKGRAALVLSIDQVQRLLVASGDDPRGLRDRVGIELLYGLGLRSAELRAAKVTDLDLADGAMLVRRAKRGKTDVLPIPPAALPVVLRYLREARPVLASTQHAGYLLLRNDGKPHGLASDVNKLVDRVARRARLERAHPHALRRAIATHLTEAGASICVVQWLLGHEEIRTTARYIGVSRGDLRRAVEVLDWPPCSGGPDRTEHRE